MKVKLCVHFICLPLQRCNFHATFFSYMRKAELGETITIEGNTLKLGRRVAFLTATLRDEKGKLIATGKHTKLILGKSLTCGTFN